MFNTAGTTLPEMLGTNQNKQNCLTLTKDTKHYTTTGMKKYDEITTRKLQQML